MGVTRQSSDTREKGIYKVTVVGSIANALLLVLKFVAGIVGNSAAMIADAVHSLSDFVTDIIVVVFVRISNKPEDKGHDYGHGKYETLATLIIGVILFFVGLGIFWNGATAIYGVLNGDVIESPGMIAFVAAIVSIVIKEVLYRYTVAKGIGGAILLGDKWVILDPVAAVIVSFFICKVAVQLAIPCFEELLEKSLPEETEHKIIEILQDFPEVSDPHHLRTRRIGNYCAVEVHIRMEGSTPLTEAHDTASAIEARIKALLGPSTLVSIHLEPRKR